MSLLRPILRNALRHPKRLAVVDDQRKLTYFQLMMASFYVAREIKRQTNKKHVGIMLPTSGAAPMCILGCWLANRVAVPLNFLLAPEELAYVIEDSEIDTILTAQPMLDFLGDKNPIPDHVNVVKLEEVAFKGIPPLRLPPSYSDDDLAVLLYTSGTSGKPKGVMLTHGNIASNVEQCCEHTRLTRDDTVLGVLPQFHSFGFTVLTMLPLRLGGRAVFTARFMPKKIMTLIKQHRPTLFVAVPSMYGAILGVKKMQPDDFTSLRLAISGGEPLPNITFDTYLEKYNLKLMEGYGLTETSPCTNCCVPEAWKLHSVGKSLPDVTIVTVDDDNNILGPNAEGEILIAGPNIMRGYYKLEDETKAVFIELEHQGRTHQFFRTGDIGKVDDEGYLFITGRKKEMLIVAGENVFPREIEEVLNKHESVNASAVIGKQDGTRGEVPIAFIELAEDATFDDGDLKTWCRQSLAQFKIPREIRVVDELPRNPTGKIMRRQLSAD